MTGAMDIGMPRWPYRPDPAYEDGIRGDFPARYVAEFQRGLEFSLGVPVRVSFNEPEMTRQERKAATGIIGRFAAGGVKVTYRGWRP